MRTPAAADEDAPFFKRYLEGGEMVEWGAKTIPEGGYYSLPERRAGDGLVMVGDTVGFVEVASLKGIHYAMQSGILAADAIFDALVAGDTSAAGLAGYDEALSNSYVLEDLKQRRGMRLAFKRGFLLGGFQAGLMTLTKGYFPGWRIKTGTDAEHGRQDLPRRRRQDRRSTDLQQGRRGLQERQPDP